MNLLPVVNRYFKGNLHTHTNISDGEMTPQEAVDLYRQKGYQFLCLSDHNVIVNHSEKNTEDFLMITGVEINVNDDQYTPTKGYTGQTYHMLMIAKEADNLWQPIAPTRRPTSEPHLPFIHNDTMRREYDLAAINDMIARANEKGFLVAYCHPEWSGQSYPDYSGMKGLWAVEVRNNVCTKNGLDLNSSWVYQDFLELGNRMCPLGSDDAHHNYETGGAWIMVGAEKLEYASVISALEKGDFYASCGPEIHSLTLEEGKLTVTCSDAARICLHSQCRFGKSVSAQPGQALNRGEFDVTKWLELSADDPNAFLRVAVYAPNGTFAATRAYWMNELKG